MQSKDMTVGTTYAFVEGRYGSMSTELSDEYGLAKGVLVEVKGGGATFRLESGKEASNHKSRNGQTVKVPTKNVKGTWEERLAARQAQKSRLAERQQAAEAEVALREAGAGLVAMVLGSDWASKYRVGYVGEAMVSQGRYGAVAYGSEVKVTTAVLADLVQAAYEAGKASK